MQQYCTFCSEPSVLHCVARSLYQKHNNQEESKQQKLIDWLIQRQSTPGLIKYRQVMLLCDNREFLNDYLCGKYFDKEYNQLLEYYKYRIFVPIFVKSASSQMALSYYYQKLKLYYNNIKRKLNITVQPSSKSSSYNTYSHSEVNVSTKEELLMDLKKEFETEENNKNLQSIKKFKSQSKALEELVCYLKLNKNFDKIKTLKTQDCFNQQNIFEQTSHKKASLSLYFHQEDLKPKLKSKLFKKIIEEATSNKQVPVYQIYKEKNSTQIRSKSIKILKTFDNKQLQFDKNSTYKASQMKLKTKNRQNPQGTSKKNSSLTKIGQNHYNSPYKRKTISNDKNKAGSLQASKTNRSKSVQNLMLKNFESNLKTKQTLIKIQVLKFQNAQPYKSTPTSPLSSRKQYRPGIQVTKTDNIFSIRKKKLQALKEKAKKK